MSQLSVTPVLTCKRCGTPIMLAHLETTVADPEGRLLGELLKSVANNALCTYHKEQRNYYASQGRLEDWEHGNL